MKNDYLKGYGFKLFSIQFLWGIYINCMSACLDEKLKIFESKLSGPFVCYITKQLDTSEVVVNRNFKSKNLLLRTFPDLTAC